MNAPTRITVTLRRPGSTERAFEAEFVIETHSADSLAPATVLEWIGVEPVGVTAYEPTGGTSREYRVGLVQFEFMGEVTTGRILFGPDNTEPRLGTAALEALRITARS